MTRILLVDDDLGLLDALGGVLARAGFEEVARCATAREAIVRVDAGVAIDVALIDLGLPDLGGVHVVRALRRRLPAAVPLVFTVQEDAPSVYEAFRAGARGYVLKSTPLPALLAAIRDAEAGDTPISPRVARFLVDALADNGISEEDEQRLDALTRREREVLQQLARGLSYADVGLVLGIGVGTVQAHVKHIYAKLEVASKAEVAALAAKLGWV